MLHKEVSKTTLQWSKFIIGKKPQENLVSPASFGGTTFPLLALKCEKQTSNNHFAHEIGLVFSTYGETAFCTYDLRNHLIKTRQQYASTMKWNNRFETRSYSSFYIGTAGNPPPALTPYYSEIFSKVRVGYFLNIYVHCRNFQYLTGF